MHSTWNIADFRQRQIVLYYFMIEATSSLASSSDTVFQIHGKSLIEKNSLKSNQDIDEKGQHFSERQKWD